MRFFKQAELSEFANKIQNKKKPTSNKEILEKIDALRHEIFDLTYMIENERADIKPMAMLLKSVSLSLTSFRCTLCDIMMLELQDANKEKIETAIYR